MKQVVFRLVQLFYTSSSFKLACVSLILRWNRWCFWRMGNIVKSWAFLGWEIVYLHEWKEVIVSLWSLPNVYSVQSFVWDIWNFVRHKLVKSFNIKRRNIWITFLIASICDQTMLSVNVYDTLWQVFVYSIYYN